VDEIIYLPEVECVVDIENGLLNTTVIGVPDEQGNRAYLRVGKGFVTRLRDKTYLPIGVVELDYSRRRALVELPLEADSGARRLWVLFTSFRPRDHGE
jgi:hypothetical protein